MIIKGILIFVLMLCLLYAFLQRQKSRLVTFGIAFASLLGSLFVLYPGLATSLANWLGVGRGADLILYFWIVISILLLMSLQFKILALQRVITEIARELSLRSPLVNAGLNATAATLGESKSAKSIATEFSHGE